MSIMAWNLLPALSHCLDINDSDLQHVGCRARTSSNLSTNPPPAGRAISLDDFTDMPSIRIGCIRPYMHTMEMGVG